MLLNGANKVEPKAENLLQDVSSLSSIQHVIIKLAKHKGSLLTPKKKKKSVQRTQYGKQLSEIFSQQSALGIEECHACRSQGRLLFEGRGGKVSLRYSFSSVAQKHFSGRRAHFGDWQFPSLSLQP